MVMRSKKNIQMKNLDGKKMQMFLKIIIGIVPVLVFLIWFAVHQIEGKRYSKFFFESSFESKVVSFQSYYGRTVEFRLDNGFKLYFSPPIENKIKVGDLIKKRNGTYEYLIYRKTSNEEYELWSINNFNELH